MILGPNEVNKVETLILHYIERFEFKSLSSYYLVRVYIQTETSERREGTDLP